MTNKRRSKQEQLPELDVEVHEYEDGSVGATLTQAPIGDIWAKDIQTLQKGMVYLMDTLIKQEKKRMASGNTQGAFGNGMQGMWMEGEFVVRWLSVVGFGVAFPSPEALTVWLKELLKVAIKAARIKV
jgi:hypothetical protein